MMYSVKYLQRLPLCLEDSWIFFSNPENLKIITLDFLNFEITNFIDSEKMYPGQIITYSLRPFLNIPIQWITEITHVQEPYYFVDEQRFGPYSFWHHEHRFKAIPNGVEMSNTIFYMLPFGPLGKILHHLKIKHDLEKIFSYREAKLKTLFGPYNEEKKK